MLTFNMVDCDVKTHQPRKRTLVSGGTEGRSERKALVDGRGVVM